MTRCACKSAEIDNEECQPRNRKITSTKTEMFHRAGLHSSATLSDLWPPPKSLPKRHSATQLVNANWLWLVMSNDNPFEQVALFSHGWRIFLFNLFSRCADYLFHNYYYFIIMIILIQQKSCSPLGTVSVLSHFCGAWVEAGDVHFSLRSSTADSKSIQTRLRINLSQCQTVWRLERSKCF